MEQEDEYWSYLVSTQIQIYPGFIKQVSSQVEAGQDEGQVAVIKFQDIARPQYQVYSNPEDLRRYFDTSPRPRSPDAPVSRRLFVLEGLPKSFIQLLGSRLGVPPSFFAVHYQNTGKLVGNLLNRTLRDYESQGRFTLTFPRLHSAMIDDEANDTVPLYFMQSSITRQLHRKNLFGDVKGPLWSFEQVSFWTVLLVDPPLKDFVMRLEDRVPRLVRHLSFEDFNSLACTKSGDYYSNHDARLARLRIAESEVIRKQIKMSVSPGTYTVNFHTWLDKSWTHPWTQREFGGLMQAKLALVSINTSLSYNMDALGINGESPPGAEWEHKAWNSLQNAVTTLRARVDIMSEAYTQTVSIRESIIANQQARQVGYLTSLATLFVPISFIAAVFSIGGDYAVDEKRFYVFWAVSLPAAVAALSIYLFGGYILKLLPKRSISKIAGKSSV
ncbi:hypothetical protein F4678DRAFT_471380 [Xylaria arbuscula]|nr:hypothetical protein F4678DRAFT_471380 [Xylaria arbuscula]